MMNTKNRKRILLRIAALLTVALLTGCGTKTSTETESTPAGTAGQTAGTTQAEAEPAAKKHFSIGYLPSTGHPDAYKAYLKALIQAYKFYQENQDKTVEDIVKYVSVDADLIRQETYGEHISSYPDPDKKTIVEWKDHMVDLGYFEDFDIAAHVNTDLYKSALDAVIQEHPDDAAFYEEMVKHYQEYDQ